MGDARFYTLDELNEQHRAGRYLGIPFTEQRLVLESDFRDEIRRAYIDGAYWGNNHVQTDSRFYEATICAWRNWMKEELKEMTERSDGEAAMKGRAGR